MRHLTKPSVKGIEIKEPDENREMMDFKKLIFELRIARPEKDDANPKSLLKTLLS